MTQLADVGVIGMATMGSNLARNLARNDYKVAIYNREYAKTRAVMENHSKEGAFIPTTSFEEFVNSLSKPRCAIIMVKAGLPTDEVITKLSELMEPGDMIVDGGNSLFSDTIRREKAAASKGLEFVGCGISGGEEGALNGPAIMPGGSVEAYKRIGPMLEKISAKSSEDNEPCCTHVGANGAGHFVKMVHNAIEYADMQVISEAYDILRKCLHLSANEIAEIFAGWNSGVLSSYLIEITVDILRHRDLETQKPLVDLVLDQAQQKGTGSWTVQVAAEMGVPISGIAEAVFARSLSSSVTQRELAQAKLGTPDVHEADSELVKDSASFIEDVRQALYASKIVAYSQGLGVIQAGADKYNWDIDLGNIAKIWRAGCIIRASFLDKVTQAYRRTPGLPLLLADDYFLGQVQRAETHWRRVVSFATNAGISIPVFSSSLSYFDAIRDPLLPTNLIQTQRDYFGAHTYQRMDKPGVFHTLWSTSERQEVEV